jgi:hypothetical protein
LADKEPASGKPNDEELVLGIQNDEGATPTPETALNEDVKKKFPFLAAGFILIGIGFLVSSLVIFLKGKKKDYNFS